MRYLRRYLAGLGLAGGIAILLLLPWVGFQVGGFGHLFWLLVFLVGLPLIRLGDQYFYGQRREHERTSGTADDDSPSGDRPGPGT